VKQRQQKELAESIVAKVQKELENPKVLQQILQQSIADVESKPFVFQISFSTTRLTSNHRNRCFEGTVELPH